MEQVRRFRKYGKPVTIESHGKGWCADDDTSSLGGPVGCEGERVCYVYYRNANDSETATFEAAEAVAKATAEKAAARREAIATVSRSTDCPHVGSEPDGEIIWRDDRSATVGYSTRVILTADGWLWHVTYDGSDGAAWGEYNLGHNTRGGRVIATAELINAIKGI